jgi:hypothetical protein
MFWKVVINNEAVQFLGCSGIKIALCGMKSWGYDMKAPLTKHNSHSFFLHKWICNAFLLQYMNVHILSIFKVTGIQFESTQ